MKRNTLLATDLWLEFIDGLRKDPNQLRQVRRPSAKGIDGRLYNLWQLLTETVDASSRYAIDRHRIP